MVAYQRGILTALCKLAFGLDTACWVLPSIIQQTLRKLRGSPASARTQNTLIVIFNRQINLNRLNQLRLAHRRTDHGCGRVAVDGLNGLKVEDTLTHDYETSSSYYIYSLETFLCHFGFVPSIRFGAQKMSTRSWGFLHGGSWMVSRRCAPHSSSRSCVAYFSPVLGDLMAFSEFTYSSTESFFIRPLYQISFVEHGRLLDGLHARGEASKPHIMGNWVCRWLE